MRKSHPDLPTYHQHQCLNKRRVGTGDATARRCSIFANASFIAVIGIGVFVIAYLLCPLQVLIAQDVPQQEQTPQEPPTEGTQPPDTTDDTPTDEEQTPNTPDETPTDGEQPPDATDETEAEDEAARLNV